MQHDIIYEVPPIIWQDGFSIGNGQMGALVYQPEGMEFGITKQDVWDRMIFPRKLTPHSEVVEDLKNRDKRLWEKLYVVTTLKLLSASPEKGSVFGEPNRAPNVYDRVRIGKERDF